MDSPLIKPQSLTCKRSSWNGPSCPRKNFCLSSPDVSADLEGWARSIWNRCVHACGRPTGSVLGLHTTIALTCPPCAPLAGHHVYHPGTVSTDSSHNLAN